jgi:uncharacterized SAM-binding protein YcdF (DUF218 family)
VPEADLVRRFAGTLGIAPERITEERHSRTTWENAVDTGRLVQVQPGERWLLVTSAWHMPRAIGCFRKAGLAVTAYPVDYLTRGRDDSLVLHGDITTGLLRFDRAAREWVGLAGYWLSGRSDALLPSPEASPASGSLKR